MDDAHTHFADTPRLRQTIIETVMREGEMTNARALDLVVRLYRLGFKIVPADSLTRAIAEHGQIPHMTQRLS